jgi:DNA-binding NtrC family response regulator
MPSVLIVDDDPQVLRLYRVTFERRRFRVMVAESVTAALEACHLSAPDVIISDVTMEDGGALEMLRLLRLEHKSIPFLVVTGCCTDGVAAAALHLGAVAVLAKTDGVPALLRAVERMGLT